MTIEFTGQVAIVTGAARGLGRSYARALAERGAHVAIADLGPDAEETAAEIRAGGGVARGFEVDVSDFAQVERMVAEIIAQWGRVDIAINNAGILRDRTFFKMDLADFRAVLDVHLMGSVHVCKAVWQPMREQQYGRILLTSSSSGMYGIFGQANYGAAKAAMLGLMNALHLEGERHGIRVNAITPSAATRMTEGLLQPEAERLLVPDAVAPAALFLVSRDAPSKVVMAAGAGTFARIYVTETEGVSLLPGMQTPEAVAEHFEAISERATAREVASGLEQADKLAASAMRRLRSA
ncbi:MAG: SDR family NAD(P)-dependent oxidoreductase [Rhizobiaceae bacterium]